MPDFSKRIIYLSDAQRQELFTNGTITVDGVTITYNENDIYVTPQSEPVTDVQVNGTSVLSNGVANISTDASPTESSDNPVKSGGVYTALSGKKNTQTAVSDPTASGNSLSFIDSISQDTQGVITATKKSVTVDASPTENSDNPVKSGGVYSANAAQNTQIANLKSDLGVVEDTNNATHTISKGQYVIWKGALYTAKSAIPSGTALSSSNLEAVPSGGLNAVNDRIDIVATNKDSTIQELCNKTSELPIGAVFLISLDQSSAQALIGKGTLGFGVGKIVTSSKIRFAFFQPASKLMSIGEINTSTQVVTINDQIEKASEKIGIKDVTYTVASTSVGAKTQLYVYVAVQSGYTPISAYFVPDSGISTVFILSNPVVSSNKVVCRIFNPSDAAVTIAGTLHVLFAKNAMIES